MGNYRTEKRVWSEIHSFYNVVNLTKQQQWKKLRRFIFNKSVLQEMLGEGLWVEEKVTAHGN